MADGHSAPALGLFGRLIVWLALTRHQGDKRKWPTAGCLVAGAAVCKVKHALRHARSGTPLRSEWLGASCRAEQRMTPSCSGWQKSPSAVERFKCRDDSAVTNAGSERVESECTVWGARLEVRRPSEQGDRDESALVIFKLAFRLAPDSHNSPATPERPYDGPVEPKLYH